ncbi:hypothetical protein [Amycolatopsis sp. NPDC021455]
MSAIARGDAFLSMLSLAASLRSGEAVLVIYAIGFAGLFTVVA